MASVNKVIIVGRLGQDVEFKELQGGNTVAKFSVATSENWKDQSGTKQEKTTWHSVVVWGNLAGLCSQYLSKGSMVYVEGKIDTRSYEDNNGVKKYVTEVIGQTVQFLSTNQESGNSNEATFDSNSEIPY